MGRWGVVFTALLFLTVSVLAIRQQPSAGHFDTSDGADAIGKDDLIVYTQEALADLVPKLPGWGPLPFKLFSGYVTVDEDAGRSLFYAYVESTRKPATDPVVLWLNGGPGCSSMAGGFLSELGPFYPSPDGASLLPNNYSWNNVASMLFLDSPAGVGWSYSNRSEDLITGDKQTARDSRQFLLGWFKRFPHLVDNPFWISGESYAGHYVPNLAWEIVKGNEAESNAQEINLQGFLVGNAWTSPAIDNAGAIHFWFDHGLISFEAKHGANKHCDYSQIGPLMRVDSPGAIHFWFDHGLISYKARDGVLKHCDFRTLYPLTQGEADTEYVSAVQRPPAVRRLLKHSEAEKCDKAVDLAMQQISGINIYDIYVDVCLPPKANAAEARQLALMLQDHPAGTSVRPMLHGQYDPCIDNEVELYFNRPDVQEALHANVSGRLPGPWTSCSGLIQYSRKDLLTPMLGVYEKLLETKLKMLVYSGDVDAIVPVVGTREWIHGLGLDVEEEWRDWRSTTGQVGGWTVKYKGLTFASVRGAGHMVPYTQPERALYLFESWVHQKPL